MAESVIVSPFGFKLPVGFPVGLRVLAVDSDAVGLEELKFMLHLCGYYVTGKKTAEEAVEEVRRSEEGFDIVMTEVHMPGMGGFELLRRVKNRLPVIMFSDDEGVETVMRSVVGGACDYMAKPLRTDMIRGIWQHVLRRKLNIIAAAAAPERRNSSLPNYPVAAAAAPERQNSSLPNYRWRRRQVAVLLTDNLRRQQGVAGVAMGKRRRRRQRRRWEE
ncbi:hypothetical protein GUJ93_ZPchr0005g15874 [Zizania palustris]|uniref:Response regulatory domain-containing protein n=1 Tax=Zizania palustris TaxID=103762 RepID=A0A8J5SHE4_ZIZPA|nr:hypothetical protein GUJ93_ZPchr0005g15874 [Zizania palustris]